MQVPKTAPQTGAGASALLLEEPWPYSKRLLAPTKAQDFKVEAVLGSGGVRVSRIAVGLAV